MLIKEGNDTKQNLEEIKNLKCLGEISSDFRLVTSVSPTKGREGLMALYYKKPETTIQIYVYEDLTVEVFKDGKLSDTRILPCEGYKSVKQKDDAKKEADVTANNQVVNDAIASAGYTLDKPDITQGRYNERIDIRLLLGGKYKNYYKVLGGADKPIYVYPVDEIQFDESSPSTDEKEDAGDVAKQIYNKVKSSRIPKKDCKLVIKTLYDYFKNKDNVPDKQLMKLKRYAYACSKLNVKFIGVADKLDELKRNDSIYGLQEFITNQARLSVNESIEDNFSTILKESLGKMMNNKKNMLIREHRDINKRFNILSENINVKNRKHVNKFIDSLIVETYKLNDNGYNPSLINEGLMDIIKGMFGNASEGIFGYFKERLAKWFVQTFTPLDPNSWIGTMIVTAIGNVPISELGQLTNCNYMTKILSKTIVEGVVAKMQNEKGISGPGYDILRNTLIETAEESNFGQKLEGKISSFLCPKLSTVSNKLDQAKEDIKQKAMS